MKRFSNVLVVLGLGALAGAASLAGCGGGDDASTTGTAAQTDCSQTDPQCMIGGSACVGLVDNSAKPAFGLRMAQLTITKPAALTSVVVNNIVSEGVLLNLPDCRLTGLGTFNWLIELDTTTNMVRTGGALPQADPTNGYCFVDEMVDTFHLQPVTVAVTLADGKFSADVGDILVPIYQELDPPGTPIILPLRAARVTDASLSPDNNCVGEYNAQGLLPVDRCTPTQEIPAFIDGATLDGFITLEEADQVIVPDIQQSLCVLLAGLEQSDGGMPQRCQKDPNGAIIAQGDWCSTTNTAGGCADSYALGATFAASAVQINGICP
jgi:hypothetical protein